MSDKKNGATGKKSTHGPKRRTAIVEALEARTLFSADILGALLDPATNEDSFQDLVSTTADSSSLSQPSAVEQNTDTSTPVTESTVSETSVTERNLVSATVIESAAEVFSEPLRHELVIIDSNTPNYQQIVEDILAQADAGRHIELVMLDPARDGLAQLNELFATYSALDAVHLISHGSAGVIALGNDLVDSDALQANADQVSRWASSFNANGDFLIYGCDLAASSDGTLFIDTLSQITGADVAASDDLTGSAKLGGDWSLEYVTGAIESHLAVSIDLQDSYDAVLVNTAPVLSGANSFTAINEDNTTSSGTLVSALIAGKISDVDGGTQGIAIIAVDNTNGSWQYTTDGSTWNAVGSPNQYNALLLAADANDAVRFVPNANYNGTVTNGITYYAWDQSTGIDGTTASTIKTETYRDNFTTQTYSNSDGTKNWSAKSWTEVGDASGATGGDIQIRAGGDLQVRAASSGDYIWREADLTGALSATVTFNFADQLTGGILLSDEVVEFQVRASSADAWTSLASFDKNSGSGSWGSVGNITGYISSTTQVRFVVTGTYSLGTGELYIDNFQIAYEAPGTGGTTAFSTSSASSSITVSPVNDNPVNTVPAAQSLNEDVSTALGGISINDVDGNLSSAQLSISHGALTVSLAGGATISAGANSSSTLTLSGTQTQINAALGTLSYLSTLNYYGSDTLTLFSTDSNGATDSDSMAITVNNVNDPISITSSATATAAENQNVAYTTTVFNPDTAETLTYSIDNTGVTSLREDNAKVSINASTGVVTFLTTPNFESPNDINPNNVYHIKIKASDNNGNTNSLAVAITITNANDAPTGGVFVGGTATENQVLSASNTLADQDGLGAISYQWQRNGVNIGGATASTYTLGDADVGAQVKVAANYTDGAGFATSVSSTSVGPVANVNDAPVGVPTITGTVTEDQTLTANTSGISDADGLGAFSYQWLRNGAVISGATATTYVLGDVDVGTNFSVRVTYTDAHGTAEGPLTSAATAAVANVNDMPVGLPVITGTLKDGQVLTADTSGISDADGLGAFTYQWKSAGVNVGANSSTYTLLVADIGNTMTVDITYTDGHGTAESLTSVATGAVSNSNTAPTGTVSIDNLVPNEGDILSASNTLADADGPVSLTVSYQWYRNGSVITGATGSTYTTVQADVGKTITVVGSYVDGLSVNEAVTSAATAAVINTNDAPIGLPTIDGASTENQTLTANTSGISDEDGLGAFSYQWLRNGAAIPGTTASTYVLGDADVGATISVQVTYTDGYSTAETLTSAPTAAITNVNDAPVGLPSIDGVVTEDQILTANTSAISDDDGLGAFTYQWFRNGASITGATASTYTLGDADVGTQISLQVSYTDSHGTSEGPLTSAPTAAVVNINDTPTLITLSNSVVDENTDTSAGYSVGGLTTTDADVGDTATYTINGGADAAFFTIGGAGSNELILTNGMLDFETKPSYAVTVRVTDAGGLFHDEVFTVNVVNVNEAPLNTVPVAQTVAEDTALNISGLSVNDVDGNLATVQLSVTQGTLNVTLSGAASISSGTNGSSTLTLSGSQTDINTTLASLSYQGNLNFNGADTLTVLSTDSGGVPLSDSDPVAITVTAVNDVPVFTSATTVNAAENQTAVLTVTSSDVDAGDTSTFSLVGGADQGLFSITAGGLLTFATAPNFEVFADANSDGVYEVQVQANDGNGGLTTQAIAVTVTNVNEAPVFTSATTANAAENQTAVLTVSTSDVDAGDTSTFSLVGGADQSFFSITAGGVLTFATAPNFEVLADANADGVYDVQVQANDGNGGLTTQTIAVTVTNVNEAPVFTSVATVNAAENQTAVLTVSTSDVDAGDTSTFSLVGGADQSLFSITAGGVLTFATAPNFEVLADANADGVYDVVVQANDGNGGLTTQTIAVTVTNVNEAPVFTSVATVNAAENQTAVLTVTSSDVDGGAPIYSISGGADSSLFSINSSSGVLTFNAAPNFELPSDSGANNVYDVVVQVSDGNGGLTTQAIAVTVTNVNEAPVFTSATTVNAAENQTAVLTVTSSDVDGGAPIYSINGGADSTLFSINSSSGVLTFNAAPNFELPSDAGANNVYDVVVQVSDGNGGLTTQTIAVTVTNVNEAPVFTSATTANAAENQTAVLTVTSSDVDAGDTSTFSLVGGADQGLFSITAGGVLTFATAPNFEVFADANSDGVYEVQVQANDGNGGLTTQAIAVTVTNVNEAPVFTSAATASAAENQTAVLTVTSSDVDGAAPIYSINGGADSTLFSINSSSGVLSFNAAPNFELPSDSGADNVYDVVVQVSDGNGGLTTQTIAVTVTNVNEAPVFTSATTANAAENQTAVLTVTSSDVDAGDTSTFSLVGGADQGLFSITAGGVLTFATAPNFEVFADANSDGVYEVQVQANDGNGGLTTQAIAVTVTNVNEAPVFTSAATANAAENQTAVLTVTSSDVDAGDTSTFSLVGGADQGLFSITAGGVLTFATAPNFEVLADANADGVYDVQVQANDGNGGLTTQTIAVTVTNVNEAPVFTSATTANAAENQTAVLTVVTTDVDGGTPVYSLNGGADSSLFSINSSSGVLSFNAAPNFELPSDSGADNVYDVVVQVSDGNGGLTTQAIAVTVTNVNEAPVFTSAATASAAENQTAVLTVTSSDVDAGDTSTFSLVGGADQSFFSITAGGVLTFATAPNFEVLADANADGVYDVQVQANDGNGGLTTQTIAVTVTNVNEAPVFTSVATVNAAENQTAVLTVSTSDVDAGDTSTFSLVGGADQSFFSITAGGVLTFATAPNFEVLADANADGVYDVQVQANDGNGGLTTQTIAVTVTNVNEAPVFTSAATASAAENQSAVLTVTSSDVDGGAPIYSISGGADSSLFSINSSSGVLTFNAAPNFEQPSDSGANNVYDVVVQVSDGNGGLTTQAIAVTVTNVNEAPVFTSAATASAAENQTAVLTVTSSDVDAGDTSTFSLVGGADQSLFSITAGGVLTFATAPNFEVFADANSDGVYEVQVQANDGNGGLTTQTIAVTVTNVNEAPVFTSVATVNAAENQTAVLTVTSSDVDGGTPVYSLNGGADSSLFSINSSSGVLTFNAAPNFELPSDAGANNVYDVVVQVSDGNGGLTTQAIAVTVTNVNEAPVFTSAATASAAENQTAVLTVSTSDVDAGDTSTFSLVGGADQSFFSITAGGVLTFATAPNFEVLADANADGVYDVQVQANDGNGGLTTQTIAVTVTNVNEAPVFTSVATVNAAENQTAVLTVSTSDVDAGDTSTFSLVGGADQSFFSITAGGVLTFAAAPNFEVLADANADGVYDVQVQANDGNGGLTTQTIAVTVTNVNEAPVFTSATTVNAAENQTAVLTVVTTDVDGGTPIYTISGGADSSLFSINSSSGVLSFNAAPNFELPSDSGANNVYDMVVQVSDGNGGFTTQAIAVTVTNVNEAPVNTVPVAQTVAEDTALNISGISVNDVDGNLSTVQLSVTQGTLNVTLSGAASISSGSNGSSALTLSGSQADINTTLASLSYQGNLNYNGADTLTVLSTDSGGVPLSDSDPVAITVTAVNDAPVGLPVISGTVTENQTLTADLSGISDVDGLGAFSYQWLRNGVAIAGATSNTYTLGDADVNTTISVRVSYTDAYGTAEGPLTSAATAGVLNVNDVPVFGGSSSGVVIKNVLSNGTTLLESIGRLSIVDLDVGEASFQASTVNGVYGQLTITADGDWIYHADNAQSEIQQLTELQTLTDTLSVTAFDGTTHTVVITIQGSVLVPVVTTTPILTAPDVVNSAVSNSVIDKNVLALGVSARQYDEQELMALPYANRINTALGAIINAPSGGFVLGDGAETATMSGSSMKNPLMKNNLAESKFIQLNKLDISWFKSNEALDTVSMSSIVNNHEFVNELYQLNRDLDDAFDEEQHHKDLSAEVSAGVSISLTAGIVSWLLRGGSLLASFMSVAPFWKQLDPLPILGADAIKKRDEKNSSDTPNNEDDEKDKQIEDIFDEDKV